MNGRYLILLVLVLALCLPAFAGAETASGSLYVRKVENLPEDFIFGMDISSVLAEEASGVKYYDFEGNETDLFALLAENGIRLTLDGFTWDNNMIRPFRKNQLYSSGQQGVV